MAIQITSYDVKLQIIIQIVAKIYGVVVHAYLHAYEVGEQHLGWNKHEIDTDLWMGRSELNFISWTALFLWLSISTPFIIAWQVQNRSCPPTIQQQFIA